MRYNNNSSRVLLYCFLLFAILHWGEKTNAQHHNHIHNNDGLHNNDNNGNGDDLKINQAGFDQSSTIDITTNNKSTSSHQSKTLHNRRRRRLTPTDDIATFIKQEHNAGISRVSFTLVGERQEQLADIDVSETAASYEDISSKQPSYNNNNPFILNIKPPPQSSSNTPTTTTNEQYEIDLIEANPSLLPTTRITTLTGEQYTYNELTNNRNVIHLVAAHPEDGDFALIVVKTDNNIDDNDSSGGGVGGIRSRIEGMARHKNEELVKIQQVEEGGTTKVILSKQKDVTLPKDWKCGVTNDHFVHSHSHDTSDNHNHNHAHHMHDEDTGVHIQKDESLVSDRDKYYYIRPNAFDGIGSRDKKRDENMFNMNDLPSFSVDKDRDSGGGRIKKGLKNKGRGGERNHRGGYKHDHYGDKMNIFSDDGLDDTDSTIHNLYADAGDWRTRRRTRRELYPTDLFPQLYTYEAKLYLEIDQTVIDSNGGNLTKAIEYINALVTASSAIFEEEVDTHCKLYYLLQCV